MPNEEMVVQLHSPGSDIGADSVLSVCGYMVSNVVRMQVISQSKVKDYGKSHTITARLVKYFLNKFIIPRLKFAGISGAVLVSRGEEHADSLERR